MIENSCALTMRTSEAGRGGTLAPWHPAWKLAVTGFLPLPPLLEPPSRFRQHSPLIYLFVALLILFIPLFLPHPPPWCSLLLEETRAGAVRGGCGNPGWGSWVFNPESQKWAVVTDALQEG